MNKNKAKEIHKAMNTQFFQATVANITNKQCQIVVDDKLKPCSIPGSLISQKNALAVGDKVEAGFAGDGQYKILRVMPRKTTLYRGDRRSASEQTLIAANAQYLLAVVTANYLVNQAGYLEAALIAARRSGLRIGLLISKCDLIGERAKALLEDKLLLYRDTADAVFFGSLHKIDKQLIQAVKHKTTVVIGDRGCGKTTVIYKIINGFSADRISHETMQSTHTSVLNMGPDGTVLIDTPGFRNFVLHQITEDERNFAFPEIAKNAAGCRFRNCTHVYEEGCRVIEVLRANGIKRERYDAFKNMTPAAFESLKKDRNTQSVDYQHAACTESFVCKVCGEPVAPDGAGSQHRNHCPKCLSSVHVDIKPGDRASLCGGIMDPVSVWVRKGGEWAIIHRCRLCGGLSSNRVAADDNPMMLLSIAVKPLSAPPFPLNNLASLN